jgi:hypothetical protein
MFNKPKQGPNLLNKCSCSAGALSATKITDARYIILATLCCATLSELNVQQNHPRGQFFELKFLLSSTLRYELPVPKITLTKLKTADLITA